MGKGQGEVVRPGNVTIHGGNVFLNDDGRSKIWVVPLDFMLADPGYRPSQELVQQGWYLLSELFFVSDSVIVSNA